MFLHRDEQTDRQADKDSLKMTGRCMDRQTEKDRRLCGWVSGRSTDGRTDGKTEGQKDGQTDRHKQTQR